MLLVASLRIERAISGLSSDINPVVFGCMRIVTRVAPSCSSSTYSPAGSSEPGPEEIGGPCQASRRAGSKSVHSKVDSAFPRVDIL